MIQRVLGAILLILWIGGCAPKQPPIPKTSTEITPFLEQAPTSLPTYLQKRLYADFLSHYYRPWQLNQVDVTYKEATWAVRYYRSKSLFGENRRPLPKERFNAWVNNANYHAFNRLKRHAIVIHPTSLRLFPTHRPIFYNPKLDGEGFPFDYNQNSAIKAYTPLIVSHLSRDGGWAFVQSPFALGWVPMRDIALISQQQIERIMKIPKVVLLQEHVPIYDHHQNFLFSAKMATLFPWIREESGFYKILTPKKEKDRLILQPSLLPKEWASPMPLPLSKPSIKRVALQLLGEPYGWGGMVEDRDCSAMTRDFFAPFGIWLPRNSRAQKGVGHVIDLSKKTAEEKERAIIQKAIPFQTLLYLPGHIMLYIGTINHKAYAMHNMWGIRTQGNGRYIIGQAVITDLWLGNDLPTADKRAIFIRRIQSMNIVTQK
ncbi:MAG: hypothetical protein DSY46_02670 [Hydrogenimonas sp.]|nr:MAG: hypothetical protein DSY46_02670 [Hydrogenimonas sp.]